MFGDVVDVTLRVIGPRRVPWMRLTDSFPFSLGPSTRWVTSLDAGRVRTHVASFTATARGLHLIGPTTVATGDSFGLRRVQATLVPSKPILVYPRIVSLEDLTVAAGAPLPLIPTTVPLYADPTRVVGVRDYQPGDPFRAIHWTASAASGDLLVKKHHPGVAREVVLAVDLTRDSHPAPGRRRSAELAVTAAASIAHHLVTVRREAVGLRLAGRDVPTGEETVGEVTPGRDEHRLTTILEGLARADISAEADGTALLDPSGLGFGSSVVLFTGVLARDHVVAGMGLARLGISMTAVVTASEQHRGAWEDEMREVGVPIRSVARLADMVEL